jgi:starch synthase
MEGLLTYRRNRLTGILNGIDTSCWDPRQDPYLTARFGPQDLIGKAVNKQLLQERLGLKPSAETVVLGIVSRFTYQKGVDLALRIAKKLLEQPAQLVVLGSGERHYEIDWSRLAWDHPDCVSVTIGHDVALAHLIEAGADLFLMPSRFEPCGLNQMYSMRYGTPPVVHRTGGLADSVVDTTPRTLLEGTATGFVFENTNQAEFLACVLRALLVYQDKKTWQKIQNNGMLKEFSWEASAARYLKIYQALAPSKVIS